MKTHKILRNRLLNQAGVFDDSQKRVISLDSLKESEWCSEFEQLMRNRLVMGAFRYETFADRGKSFSYDTAKEAIKRVQRYIADGNTEHLVDAANMCLLEFKFGKHPKKHFSSIDDGEHAKLI